MFDLYQPTTTTNKNTYKVILTYRCVAKSRTQQTISKSIFIYFDGNCRKCIDQLLQSNKKRNALPVLKIGNKKTNNVKNLLLMYLVNSYINSKYQITKKES